MVTCCPLAVLLAIVCAAVLGAHPDHVMTPPTLHGDLDGQPGRPSASLSSPSPPSWRPAGDDPPTGDPAPRVRRAPRRHEELMADGEGGSSSASPTASSTAARAERVERSSNLSHIAGAGRKIMMYIKNRHLQILPDGTVNGTDQESSDYAVIQRTSVNKVQVKMQGIATCLFLCIDACGLLYGSKELTDDCVFNETLEQHYYNTYSSPKYTSKGRSLYLALDRRGAPRRVQRRPEAPPGRLDAYTRVLTKPVAADRVADLLSRLREAPGSAATAHFRHRGHHAACPPHGHPEPTPRKPKYLCPRPEQRKQVGGPGGPARRRAGAGGAPNRPYAVSAPAPRPVPSAAPPLAFAGKGARRKCEATEDEDQCHKRLQMIAVKKRKSRNEEKKKPHLRRHKKGATKDAGPALMPMVVTTASSTTQPPTPWDTSPSASNVTQATPVVSPDHALSDEDEGDDDDEQDDSVMTTEAVTTSAPWDEAIATGSAGAGVVGVDP